MTGLRLLPIAHRVQPVGLPVVAMKSILTGLAAESRAATTVVVELP